MKNCVISLFVLLSVLLGTAGADTTPTPRKNWSFGEASLIPVQSGGRIKPLNSFALESILILTGGRSFEGWKPVDFLFSVTTFPNFWEQKKFVKITRTDVKKQLLLNPKQKLFSPHELLQNPVLIQYAQGLASKEAGAPKQTVSRANPRTQELQEIVGKLSLFRSIVSGEAWKVSPSVTDPFEGTWKSLAEKSDEKLLLHSNFSDLFSAYESGSQEQFERVSILARAAVEGEIQNWKDNGRTVLIAEFWYNKLRPFLLAAIIYLIAGVFWAFGFAMKKKVGEKFSTWAMRFTGVGFVIQVLGFVLRCYVSGRPPVSNMYESVIWVSMGTVLFGFIIHVLQKRPVVTAIASWIAGFTLLMADASPVVLDPTIHPLVPVLRSNLWLTIHVLTITISYAAFALSFGIGNIVLFHYLRKKPIAKISDLNQLSYRAVQFGVVFLAAGTILGGVWADYSWGRFWGWDPKEVWALIALLAYLALLHARFVGWVGQFGFAAWSVLSFLSVIMAWYGVNFVLGVGLHSYGFSAGGSTAVASFCLLQILYVALVWLKQSLSASKRTPRSGSGGTLLTEI